MIIGRAAPTWWFLLLLSLKSASTERFAPQLRAAVPRGVSRPGWLWIAEAARGGSTEESDLEDASTARELLGSDEGELMDNDDTEEQEEWEEEEEHTRSHFVSADSWFEEKDDVETMVESVHSEVRVDDAEIVESYPEEADSFQAPDMEDDQAEVFYDAEYEYEEEDLDEIPTTGLEPEEDPPELVQQEEEQSVVEPASSEPSAFVNSSSGNSSEMEMAQHHTTDDDSAAFVDRMDLADAYDEGEPPIGDVLKQAASRATAEVMIQQQQGSTPQSGNSDDISTSPSQADAEPVPSAIDSNTEKVLRKDLKFRRYEVKSMRPEIAVVVAQKRLRRPLEGMPRNWYRSDVSNRKWSRMMILDSVRLVLSYALPALLGGITIYGYLEFKGGRAVDEPAAKNTEAMSSNSGEAVAAAAGEPVLLPPSAVRVERRSF